jgi:hypothetical protein
VVHGHFKVEGYATARSYYSQVAATASYLLHTCPNKHVELNLTASHFSGDLYTTSDNRITLSCAFRWGGNNDAPAPSYLNDDMDSLRSWTVKPAVVIPEVQIVQDEAVVSNP